MRTVGAARPNAGFEDVFDDAESAFDDSDYGDEFPVTRLYPSQVPPLSRTGTAPTPSRKAEGSPRRDFTLPTRHVKQYAVERHSVERRLDALVNSKSRWKKILDSGGSLSPPPSLETMSISTLPDSCLNSCLDSVLGPLPLAEEVRAAPVSISERLILNSRLLRPDHAPDIDSIVQHLDRLELDEQAFDEDFHRLIELFPELQLIKDAATSLQHPSLQQRRDQKHDDLESLLRGPSEDVYRAAPGKVLPWLDSVEEPSSSRLHLRLSPPPSTTKSTAPPFTFHPDEFISTPRQNEDGAANPSSSAASKSAKKSATNKPSEPTQLGRIDHLTCFGGVQPRSKCRAGDLGNDLCSDHGVPESPEHLDNRQGDSSSVSGCYSDEALFNIGNHAREQLFGPDSESVLPLPGLMEATRKFIDQIVALQRGTEDAVPVAALAGSNNQSGKQAFGSGTGESSSRKRKADGTAGAGPGRGDGGQDETSSGGRGNGKGGADGKGPAATGDRKGDGRLEFTCPFRLKDPIRFNTREWHDCANKSYVCDGPASKRNELNELRRHIKQKHSGPGILSQPYCSTCKEEFLNATLLDEHARRGDCLYRELPSSFDPLDGLTPEAERALRSKQGRQGDTALNQYRQICKIVLGEHTEILSPGYLPVVEHFELQAQYLDSLPRLRDALLREQPFQTESDVDALLDTIHVHMVDVFGKCNDRAVATMAISHKRRKTTHAKAVSLIGETNTHMNPSAKAPTPGIARRSEQWLLPRSSCAKNATGSSDASVMPSSCWQEGGTWDSTSSAIESLTDGSSLPGTIPNTSDSGPPLPQHATNKLDKGFGSPDPTTMTSTFQSGVSVAIGQLDTAGLGTHFPSASGSYGSDEQLYWRQTGETYDSAFDPLDILAFGLMFPPDPSQVT